MPMASQRTRSRMGDRQSLSLLMMMLCLMMPAASQVQRQLPFQFHPSPDHVVLAHKNQPLLLNCSVTSSREPSQTWWRFESEDIPTNDQRRVLKPDGSLFIKKFLFHRKSKKSSNATLDTAASRKNDEGRYFCIVKNSAGAVVTQPIRVVGSKPPPTSKSLQTAVIEAELGSNVRLSCQSNYSSDAIKYHWLIDNQLLNDSDRYHRLPSGILQVVNVTESDASVVTCHIGINSDVFPVKEWRIAPIIASILSTDDQESILKREILSPFLQLTHKTKESVVFECLPRQAEDIESVSWKRLSGVPLPDNHTIDQFGNLHFSDLKLEDSDSYVCSLNAISNATNVTQLHTLKVIDKPSISKLPQNLVSPSSQTARFECAADGFPLPHVQWFKDAVPLSLTGRISSKGDEHTLLISQSVSSDAGMYQCLVENEAGSATAAAQLLISAADDQPRPPRILSLEPLSPSSVRLQFESSESPEEISIIKAYTIHYTAAGGQELQLVSPNTTVVVDNLIPFTNYSFYVRAYGNSASEPSAISFVQTKEDVPIKGPKIELVAISPTALRVSWSLLPLPLARGQVTKYEIHYKKRSQTAYHVTDVPDGRIDSFVLEDLQPSHKYDVRVLAGTSAGFPKVSEGPLWSWTSIEMPAIDQHILSPNFNDSEIENSSMTPFLDSHNPQVPEKHEKIIGISIMHLLIWIMAGSAISAALVCLCILTLHCRKKSSPATPRSDRNGNCAPFVNGHLPSMYGDVAEGREMESFLESSVAANKSESRQSETRIDPKEAYVSLSRSRKTKADGS